MSSFVWTLLALLFQASACGVTAETTQRIRTTGQDQDPTIQIGNASQHNPARRTGNRRGATVIAIVDDIHNDDKEAKKKNSNRLTVSHSNLVEDDVLGTFLEEDVQQVWQDRFLMVESMGPVPTTTAPTRPPTKAPIVTTATPSTSQPILVPPPEPTESPTASPSMKTPTATLEPTTSSDTDAPEAPPTTTFPPALPPTMWDLLTERQDQFSVLITASQAVGFDVVLQNPDTVSTLFAPNNAAFENLLPPDMLDKYLDFDLWTDEYISRLLACHDIMGNIIFTFQFQNGTRILPCLDVLDPAYVVLTPPFRLTKSTLPVPANLVPGEEDLLARNGVVHVIDQVLTNSFLRLDLPEFANAFGGFSILLELILVADLLDFASSPGPYTLYGPQDSVWLSYGQDFIDDLLADPVRTRELLMNHVVPDVIVPTDGLTNGTEFTSAAGFPLVIENVQVDEPRAYTINGVPTFPLLVGILASNAKLNTVDDILFLPPSDAPSLVPDTFVPSGIPGTISPSDSDTNEPTPIGDGTISPSGIPESFSFFPSDVGTNEPTMTEGIAFNTTWDIVTSRPDDFATFIALSEAVGFDPVLQNDVTRTVFLPNEDAFRDILPRDLLIRYLDFPVWTMEYIQTLLFCHEVANAEVLSSEWVDGTTFTPCIDLGDPDFLITLSPPDPPRISKLTMPGDANIVEVDILAENGVVHVIDQVLINRFLVRDLVESAFVTGRYQILLELVELTDLLDFAQGDGPFTLFAVQDEVFESYGQAFIDNLRADLEGTRTLLLNHIVTDVIIPCCRTDRMEYTSMAGSTLVLDNYIENAPSDFTVNGIPTVPELTDLLTSNAKVNTITDILFLPIENTGSPSSTSVPSPAPGLFATVWDLVMSRPDDFASYIQASEAVGYDTLLQDATGVTIFLPNEEAFNSIMPSNLLEKYLNFDVWTDEYIFQLISCHDIFGVVVDSSDLVNGREFSTCVDLYDPEFILSVPPPVILKETLTTPSAIVEVDLTADNGVVHVVDQVLTTGFLRFDALDALEALGVFSILIELIVSAELDDFVTGEGPFVLFAPTDDAFLSYGDDLLDALRSNPVGARMVLLNHVVSDVIISADLDGTTPFTSAAGFSIVLDDFSESGFNVNGFPTEPGLANLLASNAKINAITDILFPPVGGMADDPVETRASLVSPVAAPVYSPAASQVSPISQ